MNLERIIAGTSYLPARGITFITDGVIDAVILSEMMTNPDEYSDSDHDGIVAPYRLEANGTMAPVASEFFEPWAKLGTRERLPLPANIWVRQDPVYEKYWLLKPTAYKRLRNPPRRWTTSPQLSPRDMAEVLKECPSARVNSVATLVAESLRAYEQIEAACQAAGMPLNRRELPGWFKDWEPIFHALSDRCRRSRGDTFKGHLKSAGFAWRQGRQDSEVSRLTQAVQSLLVGGVK